MRPPRTARPFSLQNYLRADERRSSRERGSTQSSRAKAAPTLAKGNSAADPSAVGCGPPVTNTTVLDKDRKCARNAFRQLRRSHRNLADPPPLHLPQWRTTRARLELRLPSADGATAAAAFTAGTGLDVGTDPVPAVTAPPIAVRTSFFFLHIRRGAAHMAVDPALGATALADASQPSPPAGRQRRSRGPAQAARHAAFLASKQRAAADDAQALVETDARGDDGGGV